MSYPFNPTNPEFRMAMRIEGGQNFGLEAGGELDMAYDVLARMQGESKYDTLQDAWGARDDGSDPLADWDSSNAEELLRSTLGPADMFVEEYDAMTDEERVEHFPDPTVAVIVELWANSGRPTA